MDCPCHNQRSINQNIKQRVFCSSLQQAGSTAVQTGALLISPRLPSWQFKTVPAACRGVRRKRKLCAGPSWTELSRVSSFSVRRRYRPTPGRSSVEFRVSGPRSRVRTGPGRGAGGPGPQALAQARSVKLRMCRTVQTYSFRLLAYQTITLVHSGPSSGLGPDGKLKSLATGSILVALYPWVIPNGNQSR